MAEKTEQKSTGGGGASGGDKNAPSGERKPLNLALVIQMFFAVINIAVVGGSGYLIYSSTLGWHSPQIIEEELALEKAKQEEDDTKKAGPLVFTMDKFTVNLNGEPQRTIRMEVNFEMLGKDGFEEIINNDNLARARDKIVQILNSKNFADLEPIQGKLFLKSQIANETNKLLEKGVVKDVFFTEFVVQ